jgi:hypothetical protein
MTRVINQDNGAISFTLRGENKVLLNWKNNMVEVWNNGKREFIINMEKGI